MVKLISDIYKNQGYKTQLTFLPWKRAYSSAKNGKYDGTAYWFDRPDRRNDFIFPKYNLSVERPYFYYHKSVTFDWTSFSDLENKTIIINRGYTYCKEFFDAVEKYKIKKMIVDKENQNFFMLSIKKSRLHYFFGKTI